MYAICALLDGLVAIKTSGTVVARPLETRRMLVNVMNVNARASMRLGRYAEKARRSRETRAKTTNCPVLGALRNMHEHGATARSRRG